MNIHQNLIEISLLDFLRDIKFNKKSEYRRDHQLNNGTII